MHFMDAIHGRDVGETLESPRERSSTLHPDVSLIESIVRVVGVPKLACAANVSELPSPQITTYSVSFLQQILLVWAAVKRKRQGGDRRKGTISPEGKE